MKLEQRIGKLSQIRLKKEDKWQKRGVEFEEIEALYNYSDEIGNKNNKGKPDYIKNKLIKKVKQKGVCK